MLIRALMTLGLTSGRPLSDLRWLRDDPMVRRFCETKALHNRHARSYFPLLCHIAQSGHFLWVQNRPGNVHDGYSGAVKRIRQCIHLIRKALPKAKVEVRLDSAFFTQKILVPLWKWLELKPEINSRKHWRKTSNSLRRLGRKWRILKWGIDTDLMVDRHKLSSKGWSKTFQLDLFTPDDGIYEYHVLVTNKAKGLLPENVLASYNGRCAMEKQIGELKKEFGLDAVLTLS